MPLDSWQTRILNLFTEVGKVEGLVRARVMKSRPAGLNENQFVILVYLVMLPLGYDTRAAMAWALEGLECDIEAELAPLVERGFVEVQPSPDGPDHDRLSASALGRRTHEDAIRALTPAFKQALAGIPDQAIENATETMREIRRTLDNLPDR